MAVNKDSIYSDLPGKFKNVSKTWVPVGRPIILATWKYETRSIMVQGQPRQIVP
jgi:hypothetical protein